MSPTGRALLIAPAIGPVIAGFLFYLFVDNEIEILVVYTPVLALLSYLSITLLFHPVIKALRKRQWAGWLSLVPLAVIAQLCTIFIAWIIMALSWGALPWQAVSDLFTDRIGQVILYWGVMLGTIMGAISGFVFWRIARTDPAYRP